MLIERGQWLAEGQWLADGQWLAVAQTNPVNEIAPSALARNSRSDLRSLPARGSAKPTTARACLILVRSNSLERPARNGQSARSRRTRQCNLDLEWLVSEKKGEPNKTPPVGCGVCDG